MSVEKVQQRKISQQEKNTPSRVFARKENVKRAGGRNFHVTDLFVLATTSKLVGKLPSRIGPQKTPRSGITVGETKVGASKMRG